MPKASVRQWIVALACLTAAAFMGGWPVPP